jgi:hypothetical protein
MSGIRRFMGESQCLEEVEIEFRRGTEPSITALLSTIFLKAVTDCHKLKTFRLSSDVPIPSIELAPLLETTRTLERFTLGGVAFEAATANGLDFVVQAFVTNRTLKYLSIVEHSGQSALARDHCSACRTS